MNHSGTSLEWYDYVVIAYIAYTSTISIAFGDALGIFINYLLWHGYVHWRINYE